MNLQPWLLSTKMRASLLIVVFAVLPAWFCLAGATNFRDSFHDGTPDFLRLEDAGDRDSFRRWFTFLAEVEYFTAPAARPAEITDCSALIRFAYREALRAHDSAWAANAHLPLVPAFDSIAKYSWPRTPLGAALFRVKPGPFTAADLHNGAFAQFADAASLQRYNTFRVTRDVSLTQAGDLLFYFRPDHAAPYHSMIVIGRSQIRPEPEIVVVYDTGPEAGSRGGSIRRRTLNELLHYPDPQWQPRHNNPVFLGVFRWNILRGPA